MSEDKNKKHGYKKSLVMKHGVKIIPVGLAAAGGVASRFNIKIIKPSKKTGKPVEVKQKNPKQYPASRKVDKIKNEKGKVIKREPIPSVWDKIDQIYDHYYKKIIDAETYN